MNFKFWLILTLSLIASLLIGWRIVLPLLSTYQPSQSQSLKQLNIGNSQILVEIADESAEIQLGLSDRTSLPKNQGMLFILPQRSQPVFWMKDMNFPLDIIWIDNHTVVEITPNLPAPVGDESPATHQSQVPVTQVLEVNAGWVEDNNVNIGDSVYLP